MANVKVSELPAASAASTSQEFEVNDSGTSKKVTGSQIKSFVKDGLVLTDITDVTASITELNYVDGVTSSVQDQLNDKFKQRTITGTTDQITVTNGDGVAGNPTIAPVIASQAEAEAGTNSTKLMTPQRIEQHMLANALGWGGTVQRFIIGTGRVGGVTYQNTTGRPMVWSFMAASSPIRQAQISPNNIDWFPVMATSGSHVAGATLINNGWYYRFSGAVNTGNATYDIWTEVT